jgi:hypothetical protein
MPWDGEAKALIDLMTARRTGWSVYFLYPSPVDVGNGAVARLYLGVIEAGGTGKEADLDRAKKLWPRHADRLILVSNLYSDKMT